MNPNLLIAMSAWGDNHVGLMLDVALPSLLAAGNLPALRNPGSCELRIYTSADDAVRISRHPIAEAVQKIVPASIHVIDTKVPEDGNRHAPCSLAFAEALRVAASNGIAFCPFPPDVVYGDGMVNTIQHHSDRGVRALHVAGLRTRKDSMSRALTTDFKGDDGVLRISNRDLAMLALINLHPCMAAHVWENGDGPLLPSNLFWLAEGRGLLGRCFHPAPVMIWPTTSPDKLDGTIDDDFALRAVPNLDDHLFVTDSDDGLMVSLDVEGPSGSVERDVEALRLWAHPPNVNELHRWAVQHRVWIHHDDVQSVMSQRPWHEASARSAAVMDQVLS